MKYILLSFFILLQTSCMSILGFRNEKTLTNEQIAKLAKRFHIPQNRLYKVNSLKYKEIINSKVLTKKDKQNIEQPNQILVYNTEMTNVTNLINCNIGGFPILKWNRFNGLDSIPIRQGYFYTTPIFLSAKEFDNIVDPDLANIKMELTANPKYYYYILWSRTLFRDSKKIIKKVNNNLRIANSKNIPVEIKFIFSDSMFY